MKEEKTNIDLYRLIAAFMIVAIHTYPFDGINENLDYFVTRVMFRIAVPFFLMITGYYLLPKAIKKKETLISYTKKILKIYFISILIYIPINIYMGDFKSINILKLIKDILVDGTMYHLWYFPALILGIWLTYYLIKNVTKKLLGIFISILYIIGLFGDSYYGLISNIQILKNIYKVIFSISSYTRNGLFYVPIFLYIGYIFNDEKHKKNNPHPKTKISKKNNMLLITISLILMGLEGMLLYKFNIPKHTSMYIFLIPSSYLIFSFILEQDNKPDKKLRNIATWIYILHPFFIVLIRFAIKITHLENTFLNSNILNYILVSISTLVFISIIYKIIVLLRKNYLNI